MLGASAPPILRLRIFRSADTLAPMDAKVAFYVVEFQGREVRCYSLADALALRTAEALLCDATLDECRAVLVRYGFAAEARELRRMAERLTGYERCWLADAV